MKKWLLLIGLMGLLALGAAACGGGSGDTNTEIAADSDGLPVDGEDQALGGADYEVSVRFDQERYEMTDADVVVRLLGGYDAAAEVLSAESLPPQLYGVINTDVEEFCDVVRAGLDEEVGSISELSCGPVLEPGDPGYDDSNPDGAVTNAVCAEDAPDCEDTIVNGTCLAGAECDMDGGELPLAPPDLIPAVENQYTITIRFNETVLADHLDEVGARIRDFDPDAEYVVQESFPPTGVANFAATTEDACLALVQGLEAETFVTSVSCGPQLEPGDMEHNDPVSATPLLLP